MLLNNAFARLVAEDVKGRLGQDQKDYLRLSENWEQWRTELLALLDDLDRQLNNLREEAMDASLRYGKMGQSGQALLLETSTAYEDKQKKITRFRFFVEQRLAEVDRMIALGEGGLEEDIRLAGFLLRAIQAHEVAIKELDLEPTPVDEALWAARFGRWEFNKVNSGDV